MYLVRRGNDHCTIVVLVAYCVFRFQNYMLLFHMNGKPRKKSLHITEALSRSRHNKASPIIQHFLRPSKRRDCQNGKLKSGTLADNVVAAVTEKWKTEQTI